MRARVRYYVLLVRDNGIIKRYKNHVHNHMSGNIETKSTGFYVFMVIRQHIRVCLTAHLFGSDFITLCAPSAKRASMIHSPMQGNCLVCEVGVHSNFLLHVYVVYRKFGKSCKQLVCANFTHVHFTVSLTSFRYNSAFSRASQQEYLVSRSQSIGNLSI